MPQTIVPNVQILIEDKTRTTRIKFAPIYEVPLLEKVWAGRGSVTATPIPDKQSNGQSWPEYIIHRKVDFAQERARIHRIYERHPITKDELFESIYGFGRFAEAFKRAVSGEWTPESNATDAPTPVERQLHPAVDVPEEKHADGTEVEAQDSPENDVTALQRIAGLGPELAEELVSDGVRTVEDVADLSVEELQERPGIGPVTAKQISEAAQDLLLQGEARGL